MKYHIVSREQGSAAHPKAWLRIECPHGRPQPGIKALVCSFSIWQGPAGGAMWNWDGNTEKPTIKPSINCHGGCGRHFTMISGEPK